MADHLRLFIGIPVALDVVDRIYQSAQRLARANPEMPLRWVQPATYHVTLKFLGWTRPETVAALQDRIERAVAGLGETSFLAVGGGAFPDPKRGRVVWVGVKSIDDTLATLAQRIDEATTELGFPPRQEAFHPHMTLARFRQPTPVTGLLDSLEGEHFGKTAVREVLLYESEIRAGGADYAIRARWPLIGS